MYYPAITSDRSYKAQTNYSIFVLAILAMALVMAGCGNNATGPDNGNGEPGENEVRMVNHSFNPSTLTVEPGTTVTWINDGNETHTVTSNDDLFDSSVAPGEQFQYTFEESGTFDYHCVPHPGMEGSIVVEGS